MSTTPGLPTAPRPVPLPPLPVPPPPSLPPLPSPPAPLQRLAAIVERQAGVVSRAQALAAGLGVRQVDRYVTRRRWRPVHPRVYLVGDHPLTDEARVRAAALWAGEGAVVVGAAAVWWHGLTARAPRTVAVAVPGRRPADREGVTAQHRLLAARDRMTLRGLAVPVRPLALLDAAVEAGAAGPALLDRALRADVDLPALRAVAASSAGTATALRLLEAVASSVGVTSTPRPHLAEWSDSRNRYSKL